MTTETDLELSGGRRLHVYDTGADNSDGHLVIFWHHGTPNIGAPPEPLFPAAARLGIRWVSYDRPRYGGSTPHPGRTTASAAGDVAAIAAARGIDRFAGMTDSTVASLRAAAQGRAAKEHYEASAEYDPEMFTAADHAALSQEWSWFGDVVGPARTG